MLMGFCAAATIETNPQRPGSALFYVVMNLAEKQRVCALASLTWSRSPLATRDEAYEKTQFDLSRKAD